MKPTKIAPSTVIAALASSFIFALVAQSLLMSKDIGFNLAILGILLLAIVFIFNRTKLIQPNKSLIFLAVPIAIAAYGFAVPDSRGLDILNLFMVVLSISYFALRNTRKKELSLSDSIIMVPVTTANLFLSGVVMPTLADWKQLGKAKSHNISRGILLGCLAAIPFLIIFGNVLAQADPIFAKLFSFNMNLNLEDLMPRFVIFSFAGCYLSGLLIHLSKPMFDKMLVSVGFQRDPSRPYLYPIGPHPAPHNSHGVKPKNENEHVAIFATFFGLLASMFLVFILVQLRYLFGGDSLVLKTANLTYADYARRGFLEIVGVAAVCLPLLIVSQYMLRNFSDKIRKVINFVVVITVSLLLLLLASAAFRLKLYVGAYGLSPLRVYVGAGMVWLLILFVSYLRYGTQWKLDRIGKALYASMIAITMGLNVVKPDYWIARVNLTRAEAKYFDPSMILEAGADAHSAIVQYGKGKLADAETKKDLLTEYMGVQRKRLDDWKSLSYSQLSLAKD